MHVYYKEGSAYRIPFGSLRGARLSYDRAINYHMMLGLWEAEVFSFLSRIFLASKLLAADSTVWDVGANVGFYTLWFSRFMAKAGAVYAFEPAPYALSKLRNNVALNFAWNVQVCEYAVSDRCGTGDFYLGRHHHSSSLDVKWAQGDASQAEPIAVSTTTLNECLLKGSYGIPNFIKIDIEGGGAWALRQSDDCFQYARPFVLIESHTPGEDQAISDVILRNRYSAFRLNTRQWVSQPEKTHPFQGGVWGTMALIPEERRAHIQNLIEDTWKL